MDLHEAARDVLTPLGYEVLEISVSSGRGGSGGKGQGTRRVLLRIDRLDEEVVSVQDVARAAGVFGLELDRLDPYPDAYRLEVESPGAERPLVTLRHFERFADLLIKVRTGGETLTGRVRSVQDDRITLELVGGGDATTTTIALDAIERARLAEWPDSPR
ncbi:ribosome maturation factor RimP [soil metagenome]|nr:ribosome maturation factor RimP [Trueperaceae bacterium]